MLSHISAPGSTTCSSLRGWSVTPPLPSAFVLLPSSAVSSGSFESLTCHPTPDLSLCASPNLFWVLAASFGVWLFTPPLLSALLFFPCFTKSLVPCSTCSLGQVQHSTPISAVGVRLQFSVYVFQFCLGGEVVQSAQGLDKEDLCDV
jgi:hypothetical protein